MIPRQLKLLSTGLVVSCLLLIRAKELPDTGYLNVWHLEITDSVYQFLSCKLFSFRKMGQSVISIGLYCDHVNSMVFSDFCQSGKETMCSFLQIKNFKEISSKYR